MNKKEKMTMDIYNHGNNLLKIFPKATIKEPIALCKKLFYLEKNAHRATTCLCNENKINRYDVKQASEKDIDIFFNKILDKVISILGEKAKDIIFINYDARGYAIKIKRDDNMKIYSDFGGYGILAPDFRA